MSAPIVAITMGDPAGIGAEIVLKALRGQELRARSRFVLIGDPAVWARAAQLVQDAPALCPVASPDEATRADALAVWPTQPPSPPGAAWGQISVETARAMLAPLDAALEMGQRGVVQAIVSAPLNKEAFALLGHPCADELQYMATRAKVQGAFILGVMRGVWVSTVTEHVPFRAIADLVTRDNVLRSVRGLQRAMLRGGCPTPRIAVAALNVHGGEGGAMGTEEITEIAPAVQAARSEGIDVVGPIPADTVFARALAGEFTGVVGMYHDQANIARKLQPMHERVTIFEGLPVPCTTTAHGVAYDIAGRGVADAGGMRAAIEYAIRLAQSSG